MNIDDIKKSSFVLGFLDLLFLISPGILCIFVYKERLIYTLDWVKLSLLAIALIAPFVFLNSLISMAIDHKNEKKDNFLFVNFSMSIIFTGLIFYLLMIVDYLSIFNIKTVFSIFVVTEVTLFLIMMWIDERREKDHAKRKEI